MKFSRHANQNFIAKPKFRGSCGQSARKVGNFQKLGPNAISLRNVTDIPMQFNTQ